MTDEIAFVSGPASPRRRELSWEVYLRLPSTDQRIRRILQKMRAIVATSNSTLIPNPPARFFRTEGGTIEIEMEEFAARLFSELSSESGFTRR